MKRTINGLLKTIPFNKSNLSSSDAKLQPANKTDLKTSQSKTKRLRMVKKDINEIIDGDIDKLITKLNLKQESAYDINNIVPHYKELKPDISINMDKLKSSIDRILQCRKRMEDTTMFKNKVQELLKAPQPEQRSPQWYEMRNHMLTASDWASALKMNPYSSENKLLQKKCGHGDVFTGNAATRWGVKYEPVANMLYEKWNNTQVIEFGLLEHPEYSFLGASPDGITPEGVMLEIKCPPTRQITGIPPAYYWVQVQGQLEICDLERCDFLECKLMEYGTRTAYDEDTHLTNPTLTVNGKEKGVLIEYINFEEEAKYDYAPLHLYGTDLHTWCFNRSTIVRTDGYKFNRYIFWGLEHYSCVPIYRDKEWFKNAQVILKTFWDKVLHYRTAGNEELIKHTVKKKKTSDDSETNQDIIDFYNGKKLNKYPF